MSKKTHIIGVTGHRIIDHTLLPRIRREINGVFDDAVRAGFAPAVLSPLAKGADQLVASIAVERGFPLWVPLPLSVEEYVADFDGAEERAEFYTLLQRAERQWVVHSDDRSSRDRRYLLAGAAVALHSDTLLALWDGRKHPEKTGGTAHIVRLQFEGFPPDARPSLSNLGLAEKRRTVWIPTPKGEQGIRRTKGGSQAVLLTAERYEKLS